MVRNDAVLVVRRDELGCVLWFWELYGGVAIAPRCNIPSFDNRHR